MPKKTKRQKIAAETRKHRIVEHQVEVEKTSSSAPSPAQTPKSIKKALFSTETTVFFKKDLMKSLLITGFLLLVELGIYVAQSNGLSFNINLPF